MSFRKEFLFSESLNSKESTFLLVSSSDEGRMGNILKPGLRNFIVSKKVQVYRETSPQDFGIKISSARCFYFNFLRSKFTDFEQFLLFGEVRRAILFDSLAC